MNGLLALVLLGFLDIELLSEHDVESKGLFSDRLNDLVALELVL
jgi:hypothetical protein